MGCWREGTVGGPLRLAIRAAGRWRGVGVSQDLPRDHPGRHQETLPGEGQEKHSCHRAGAELGQFQHRGLLHPGPGPGRRARLTEHRLMLALCVSLFFMPVLDLSCGIRDLVP